MALDISHLGPREKLLEENLEDAIYTILEEQGFQLDWADQAIQSTSRRFYGATSGSEKGHAVLLVERTVFCRRSLSGVYGRSTELIAMLAGFA